MSKETTHIRDLNPDQENAREHSSRGIGMIVDSMHEVGAARSIVIDENNRILAGNGTVEAAGEAGITKVRVVEADGNEIIAVRRRGLTEDQKTKLAIADNRTAELSSWKGDMLVGLFNKGLKADKFWRSDELDGLAVVLDKKDKDSQRDAQMPIDAGGAQPLKVEPGLGFDSDVANSPGRTGNVTDSHETSKNDKIAAKMLRFVEKDLVDDNDESDRLQPVMVAIAEAIINLYNM